MPRETPHQHALALLREVLYLFDQNHGGSYPRGFLEERGVVKFWEPAQIIQVDGYGKFGCRILPRVHYGK